MSVKRLENIVCPKCGEVGEFTIWEQINTKDNPELKEAIQTGDIFKYICPKCGNEELRYYSTLYIQDEDQVAIHLNLENKEFIQLDNWEIVNKRVVYDFDSLKEKLLILDMGLDDHLIELMKILIYFHIQETNPELDIIGFWFDCSEGNPQFVLRLSNDQWATMPFDPRMYDVVKVDFGEDSLTDPSMHVDMNWALEMLNSKAYRVEK